MKCELQDWDLGLEGEVGGEIVAKAPDGQWYPGPVGVVCDLN